MLQLDALLLLLLLLLKLLQVLHLLQLLSLLLHDVGLWAQSGALDSLVGHHLRQACGGVAIVEGGHQPSLVQTTLTTSSSSQGVELPCLAHAAMHPGQPLTLAAHGALTAGARHWKMGKTGRQWVKLHSSQLLLVWHHHMVYSQVWVRHTLQMIQGYRG